jgi:hypothetical protein
MGKEKLPGKKTPAASTRKSSKAKNKSRSKSKNKRKMDQLAADPFFA